MIVSVPESKNNFPPELCPLPYMPGQIYGRAMALSCVLAAAEAFKGVLASAAAESTEGKIAQLQANLQTLTQPISGEQAEPNIPGRPVNSSVDPVVRKTEQKLYTLQKDRPPHQDLTTEATDVALAFVVPFSLVVTGAWAKRKLSHELHKRRRLRQEFAEIQAYLGSATVQ